MQSKRMDEQRVTLPYLPGLNSNQDSDDSFIEMLVRCQVHITHSCTFFLSNSPDQMLNKLRI